MCHISIVYLVADIFTLDSGTRSVILSIAVAGIMPMVDTYGVLVTNTAAAVLVWAGFGWVLILFGVPGKLSKRPVYYG